MNMPAKIEEHQAGGAYLNGITRAEFKGLVQRWRKRCEKQGKPIRSIAAYEQVARLLGYANWMRLSLALNMRKVKHTVAQVAATLPGGPL